MTVLAGSIQSFQKGTNDKNAAPIPVISTEAKRSGEISFLPWYMKHGGGRSLGSEYHGSVFHLSPIAACSPARDDDGGERPSRHFDRSAAEWRNLTPPMTEKPVRALRHFDESVAEWRNLLSLMVHEAWRPKISGLRVPLEPYIPARAPLQMTKSGPLLSWNQNKGIKKEALFRELLFCL